MKIASSNNTSRLRMAFVAALLLASATCGYAQQGPPPPPAGPPDARDAAPPPPPASGPPPDPGRNFGLQAGPPGRWWNDANLAQQIGLSADQQKRMDEIFSSNRLKLIDLSATLQKEETLLEPLVSDDSADENKVIAQIGRVAQARAELEKANARMLLDLRHQLSHDQWVKLQAERPPAPEPPRGPAPPPRPRRGAGGAPPPPDRGPGDAAAPPPPPPDGGPAGTPGPPGL